jgi:phosphate acetyl/butyryl transferase
LRRSLPSPLCSPWRTPIPKLPTANVLIFPDLQSCNIAARLLPQLGAGETLGPILSGMGKTVHLLQRGAEVEDVVNIATIAVVDAQDSPIVLRVKESQSVPIGG